MTKNVIYIDNESGCVQIGSLKINELVETIDNLQNRIDQMETVMRSFLLAVGADHKWDDSKLEAVNKAKKFINQLANIHLEGESRK